MALTLIEAAKQTDDLVRQAIIELYASSSEIQQATCKQPITQAWKQLR